MGIITISRGTKSGGILVAEKVGEKLGAKVISRPMLVEAANLKSMENSLWHEIKDLPLHQMEKLLPKRLQYIARLRATLLEMANEGNIVYHANGGQMLLRDVACALRVRIVAPMETRLKMVVDRRGGTTEDAGIYIREKDDNRVMWNRFLYGVNSIDNPLYFDLILNIEKYGIDNAADIIAKSTELDTFKRETTCHLSLSNLALAAKVNAAIVMADKANETRVQVLCEDGVAVLKGKIPTEEAGAMVIEVAGAVDGVKSVQSQLEIK
jgi:cytidylate kinase